MTGLFGALPDPYLRLQAQAHRWLIGEIARRSPTDPLCNDAGCTSRACYAPMSTSNPQETPMSGKTVRRMLPATPHLPVIDPDQALSHLAAAHEADLIGDKQAAAAAFSAYLDSYAPSLHGAPPAE